jgi:hypothetical protein
MSRLTARGYNHAHRKRRAALLPAAYGQPCPLCGEVMLPEQRLHLHHVVPLAVRPDSTEVAIVHARCNVQGGWVAIVNALARRPTPPRFARKSAHVSVASIVKAAGLKRCTRCRRMLPVEAFPANPRLRGGLGSWCRSCHVERNRAWRLENRERLNAARRRGPLPTRCADCGSAIEAKTSLQVRCPACQAERRRTRKR